MFGQYRGLRRELYILFWGKAATNMGAMIWPMLTLILSNKLGMNAQEIAKITIAMGVYSFLQTCWEESWQTAAIRKSSSLSAIW